jgi:hypothetical protein
VTGAAETAPTRRSVPRDDGASIRIVALSGAFTRKRGCHIARDRTGAPAGHFGESRSDQVAGLPRRPARRNISDCHKFLESDIADLSPHRAGKRDHQVYLKLFDFRENERGRLG